MDHQYIDRQDVVGQFLRNELVAPDRTAFQAHVVDCPECADRVLLAEMFLAHEPKPVLPMRARWAARMSPLQLTLLGVLTLVLLLAIPSLVFWWELHHIKPQ